MSITSKIADTITRKRRAAREKAVAALSAPKLPRKDLDALPDLLRDAELSVEQAERVAELLAAVEREREVIATGPARLAACEQAVEALAKHRVESQAIAEKRGALETQLERELAEARHRHTQARAAEVRLAEVHEELDGLLQLADPVDLAECRPMLYDLGGTQYQSMPPFYDLPGAPERIVSREQFYRELHRRRGVVDFYRESTKEASAAAFAKTHAEWLKKAVRHLAEFHQERHVATVMNREFPKPPKTNIAPEPKPVPVTYAIVVKDGSGIHKRAFDAS
jgi:hypothetical protein